MSVLQVTVWPHARTWQVNQVAENDFWPALSVGHSQLASVCKCRALYSARRCGRRSLFRAHSRDLWYEPRSQAPRQAANYVTDTFTVLLWSTAIAQWGTNSLAWAAWFAHSFETQASLLRLGIWSSSGATFASKCWPEHEDRSLTALSTLPDATDFEC